jgi:V/A-type H+-transporting ATPase subunit E
MNDISAILASIQEDARQYGEAAAAAAREKAEAITESYSQEAQAETARVLEAAKHQAEAIRQRAVSQSGIESRNAKLQVRRQAIDTAFQKAMEQLCAMPAAKKTAVYAAMAAQSLTGDAALVLNKADKAAIGAALPAEIEKRCAAAGRACKVTLSGATGSFAGGFILDQGSTETNCTFEVLSTSVKEELEAQVDAALFG